jgi:hypothetical protein
MGVARVFAFQQCAENFILIQEGRSNWCWIGKG